MGNKKENITLLTLLAFSDPNEVIQYDKGFKEHFKENFNDWDNQLKDELIEPIEKLIRDDERVVIEIHIQKIEDASLFARLTVKIYVDDDRTFKSIQKLIDDTLTKKELIEVNFMYHSIISDYEGS